MHCRVQIKLLSHIHQNEERGKEENVTLFLQNVMNHNLVKWNDSNNKTHETGRQFLEVGSLLISVYPFKNRLIGNDNFELPSWVI